MSIAAIARELGVAQNSIYWYFPSKDELLVALVETAGTRNLCQQASRAGRSDGEDPVVTDRLAEIELLRSAVRERALVSDAVAQFDDSLTATLREPSPTCCASWSDPEYLDDVVASFSHTVQCVLAKNLPPAERGRISIRVEPTRRRQRLTSRAGQSPTDHGR